jgi:hypothetical protein
MTLALPQDEVLLVALKVLGEGAEPQNSVFVSPSDFSFLKRLPHPYYYSVAAVVEPWEGVAVKGADAVSLSYCNCELARISGSTNYIYIFTVFPNLRVRYHCFTTILNRLSEFSSYR